MTTAPRSLPSRLLRGGSVVRTLDCHAGGEPARVVLEGAAEIAQRWLKTGGSMLEARDVFMTRCDELRQRLLLEPRGFPCQNANFVLPSSMPGAAFGFVIAEQNKIYPLMSGHNAICVATALLESGLVAMPKGGGIVDFALEAPAGLIEITAQCSADGKAENITLRNASSFVEKLDVAITVPELGVVAVDIAYGGMWYAVVDAKAVALELQPDNGKEICRVGEMIKTACREQHPVRHPIHTDYVGVDILVFRESCQPSATGEKDDGKIYGKNAVVMSKIKLEWDRPETHTGMLDRSPCGTGTCAVMAVLHARGMLRLRQPFHHRSIVDTMFVGELLEETEVAGRRAVVPTISGSGYVTQYCEIAIDPTDPFPNGFTVGDIW